MPIIPANKGAIEAAAAAIRRGDLVAFPTETVYGLGGDARNGSAVAKIFNVKGRPQFNPLIVHVASTDAAREIGAFTPTAVQLAEAFWPGPLTLILALRDNAGISSLVTCGLDTIGLRVPDHTIAQALLTAADRAIAAPSANRSGHVSPTTADHVAADLGAEGLLILDGGATPIGIESTIIDVSRDRPELLRTGAVTQDQLLKVTGDEIVANEANETAGRALRAPGRLASHYAPRAKVRINVAHVEPGEALLAFGPNVIAHRGTMINLSTNGDLLEAAANLFSALRQLDQETIEAIAVMPIPETGLGVAINDRLRRAASPRPA